MSARPAEPKMLAWWRKSASRLCTCPAMDIDGFGIFATQREHQGRTSVNAKRVYCVMYTHGLLLQHRPAPLQVQRRHDGKVAVPESNRRWCADGFEFRCENGGPVRVTFALNCRDWEVMSWVATTGDHSGEVVRNAMLAAVKNRFGGALKAPQEIGWLTDNGSGYIADRMLTRVSAQD